jgi:hypothetical protein
MRRTWNKFQLYGKVISSFVFLHLAYGIGIGVTALVAKCMGKHFLHTSIQHSTWEKRNQKQQLDTMY